jgi:glutamate racemase
VTVPVAREANIPKSPTERPVGVFDSGVGGLAVLFELQRLMPSESFVYFADTLTCPWGSRPAEEIVDLATRAAQRLIDLPSKLIVVACNSATTVALSTLRARFEISFVGTEPAIKPAAAATRSGRVGVMATQATVRSGSIERLSERHAPEVEVIPFACPDRLVELVEQAITDGDEVEAILQPILGQLHDRSVDALVLGCTHYSFLRQTIERMLGPDIAVLDTGLPVARQTHRILEREGTIAPAEQKGSVRYLASADSDALVMVAERLWKASEQRA